MLTEKQARAVCEALGVLPDRQYPFTRVIRNDDGSITFCHVTNWQAAQRAAEEAASDG